MLANPDEERRRHELLAQRLDVVSRQRGIVHTPVVEVVAVRTNLAGANRPAVERTELPLLSDREGNRLVGRSGEVVNVERGSARIRDNREEMIAIREVLCSRNDDHLFHGSFFIPCIDRNGRAVRDDKAQRRVTVVGVAESPQNHSRLLHLRDRRDGNLADGERRDAGNICIPVCRVAGGEDIDCAAVTCRHKGCAAGLSKGVDLRLGVGSLARVDRRTVVEVVVQERLRDCRAERRGHGVAADDRRKAPARRDGDRPSKRRPGRRGEERQDLSVGKSGLVDVGRIDADSNSRPSFPLPWA